MEWSIVKLGDITEVITKGTTPTSVGFKFIPEGVNFVKVESITSDGRFLPHKFAAISEECNESLKRSQLKEGDVLFSIAGALGRTALVTPDILPANTNQALAIIRLKAGLVIDKHFLLLALTTRVTLDQVEKSKGGVAQQNLSLGQLKGFEIPLPPIPEQKRIVAILDQAFADIEQARAKTEQNLKNARELFESYLQQVFSQRSEGWVETTLGNLSDINYGYTEKASFEANGPHFLRITDIQNNDVNWGKVPYCPISKADYAKHKLETGDIVFARTGATTGKSYLLSNPPEAVAASYLIRLRVKSDALLPEFVKFFFQTKGYWDVVNAGMTGSAQGGFNASKLAAMEITYPDCRDTQRVFVDKLSLVAQEIEQIISKYEKKLVVLDELKKSILQKAFSGELSKTLEVDTNKGAVA